jgi:hypothetical protein
MEYAVSITSKWFKDYERRQRGEPTPKKPDAGGRQDGHHGEVCGPVPECVVRDEPLAKGKGKKADGRRFRVSVVSRRSRLLDPDNLCGKGLVDCLRYAGAIEQDDPGSVEYRISQEKVAKGAEETVVTVERIE